jgi:hypothetical protein
VTRRKKSLFRPPGLGGKNLLLNLRAEEGKIFVSTSGTRREKSFVLTSVTRREKSFVLIFVTRREKSF